jgi:hypothetical protein
MAPIERKPLPPLNSRVTTIREADRAEIIAHANDVMDYYLNGAGSYFDGGTQKPLVSEFGNSTVDDLKNFMGSIIASKQFADDPSSIMDSIVELVETTINQVEQAARNNEGRDSISRRPPDTNDPIDDPRVISPRALGNGALPMSQYVEGEEPASALEVRGLPGISSSKPVRYLSRRDGNTPSASVLDTGASAAQFVLPDQLNSSGRPTDWATALAGGPGPLNPMQAAQPLQVGGTPGISSTKPVRILSRVIADRPQPSEVETSGSAAPFAPSNEVFSPDRRNAFVSGNDASLLAGGAGGSSMAGRHGSSASTLLEYIRHLSQLGGVNNPQASMVDPNAPGASPASSDSSIPTGGLAGRIAALTGFDPDNPDAPPAGGLLALLLAAQQR